jgi:hypothetical protein
LSKNLGMDQGDVNRMTAAEVKLLRSIKGKPKEIE